MKPDFRIEVPKPCRAGWENMEAAEKGRFCGECSKIVIDFTSMSMDEIKTYFLQHKDQKICGHFISSQISKKRRHTEQVLTDLHKKAGNIKYRIPRIAACFVIVSLMTLSGCGPTTGEIIDHTTDGDSIYVSAEMQHEYDSISLYEERTADSIAKQTTK